jgi:hypothetical protein
MMPNLDAYYDVDTDTIHNCAPYSFAWCHERIHQLQMRNKFFKGVFAIHKLFMKVQIFVGAFVSSMLSTAFFLYFIRNITQDSMFEIMAFTSVFVWVLYYPIVLLEIDAMVRGTILWWQKRKEHKKMKH